MGLTPLPWGHTWFTNLWHRHDHGTRFTAFRWNQHIKVLFPKAGEVNAPSPTVTQHLTLGIDVSTFGLWNKVVWPSGSSNLRLHGRHASNKRCIDVINTFVGWLCCNFSVEFWSARCVYAITGVVCEVKYLSPVVWDLRSQEECILRYKFLAEKILQKKKQSASWHRKPGDCAGRSTLFRFAFDLRSPSSRNGCCRPWLVVSAAVVLGVCWWCFFFKTSNHTSGVSPRLTSYCVEAVQKRFRRKKRSQNYGEKVSDLLIWDDHQNGDPVCKQSAGGNILRLHACCCGAGREIQT